MRYKEGTLFIIPLTHGYGACQYVWKDARFGNLFKLYSDIVHSRLELEERGATLQFKEWAYINIAGMFRTWQRIGVYPIVDPKMPTGIFYGDEDQCGIVEISLHEGEYKEVRHSLGTITEKELLDRGYVNQCLWLAQNIAQSIEDGRSINCYWGKKTDQS
jgi:hypothetical protein